MPQTAVLPPLTFDLHLGENIHTESSYKFTPVSVSAFLSTAVFHLKDVWQDSQVLFAVTLATVS